MKNAGGYIAVVTSLIFAGILLAAVFSSSLPIFWERLAQVASTTREANTVLANSCGYEALMQYTEDPQSLASSERIQITSNTYCVIDGIASSSSKQLFTVHANIRGSFVSMQIATTQSTSTGILTVTSWRDITSIPP